MPMIAHTNDPWWTRRWASLIPFRLPRSAQWGLDAVRFPQAWQTLGDMSEEGSREVSSVRVGIIDSNIYYNHPDLRIPSSNVNNKSNMSAFTYNHGTHHTCL